MSWPHFHHWQKVDVEFNPPIPKDERTHLLNSSAYEDQAFGFTNVTFECSKCPKVKIDSYPGRVAL